MYIIIRPARPEEANWLTEIACCAKARWGYSDEQIADWKPAFLTITSDYVRQHALWVAEDKAAGPVAFAALEHGAAGAKLKHLWVLPGYMGRGIGSGLFHHVAGRGPVFIFTSDPQADGFYLKLGARIIGEVESARQGCRLSRFRYDAATANRSD